MAKFEKVGGEKTYLLQARPSQLKSWNSREPRSILGSTVLENHPRE
jgi:hypothetical protein